MLGPPVAASKLGKLSQNKSLVNAIRCYVLRLLDNPTAAEREPMDLRHREAWLSYKQLRENRGVPVANITQGVIDEFYSGTWLDSW